MGHDLTVSVVKDTATPGVKALQSALATKAVQRAVGTAATLLTKQHLQALPPNRMGWPSQGFNAAAARGTSWSPTADGVSVKVENHNAPGAMRHRYHGGVITAQDHLLAIPARAEFYGKSPTQFTNLRFVLFASGTKALVIGKGGVGRVNFETGKESNVPGAGARTQAMVAYWLKEQVVQEPHPEVLPSPQQYLATARLACLSLAVRWAKPAGGRN